MGRWVSIAFDAIYGLITTDNENRVELKGMSKLIPIQISGIKGRGMVNLLDHKNYSNL